MQELSITLFGRFNVSANNCPVDGLRGRKLKELLCYLLLHRDRQHHRERLAGFLWDNNTSVQSKKYLRQALWKLRQSLDVCETEALRLIEIDGDWIVINPNAHFCLDIEVFEEAYTMVRDVSGRCLDDDEAQQVRRAIRLYTAELLEGWYADWCHIPRERFRQMYLFMLDKLINYCESIGAYQTGIEYATLGLNQDRIQEGFHRQLMCLYYLSNNRSAALHQYELCKNVLDKELCVAPSLKTQKLYMRIKQESFSDKDQVMETHNHHRLASMLATLENQLGQLQRELKRLQNGET